MEFLSRRTSQYLETVGFSVYPTPEPSPARIDCDTLSTTPTIS
jgi:hypothetical protein